MLSSSEKRRYNIVGNVIFVEFTQIRIKYLLTLFLEDINRINSNLCTSMTFQIYSIIYIDGIELQVNVIPQIRYIY